MNPLSWSKDVFSAATAYPNAGAPANIKNSTLPVSTGSPTDLSIADYLTEFPNAINQAGYTNLYELRLYTSNPSQLAGVTYYRVDLQVDPAAGTWTVAYPADGRSRRYPSASVEPLSDNASRRGAPKTWGS